MPDASGAALENDITSSDLSAGYKALFYPQVSESLHDSFLPSRDTTTIQSKNQRKAQNKNSGDNKTEDNPMDFDADNKSDEGKSEQDGKTRRKSRGHYYNPWCTTPLS